MEGEITLLLQRGGQAVPALVSIYAVKQCDTRHTTPIISYSILPRLRVVLLLSCLPSRKLFESGQPFRNRGGAPPVSWRVLSLLQRPQLEASQPNTQTL
jgi:hypothetical protein